MNAINTTGRRRALRNVVRNGRTRTTRRFLTVNVQTCLRKSTVIFWLYVDPGPRYSRNRTYSTSTITDKVAGLICCATRHQVRLSVSPTCWYSDTGEGIVFSGRAIKHINSPAPTPVHYPQEIDSFSVTGNQQATNHCPIAAGFLGCPRLTKSRGIGAQTPSLRTAPLLSLGLKGASDHSWIGQRVNSQRVMLTAQVDGG